MIQQMQPGGGCGMEARVWLTSGWGCCRGRGWGRWIITNCCEKTFCTPLHTVHTPICQPSPVTLQHRTRQGRVVSEISRCITTYALSPRCVLSCVSSLYVVVCTSSWLPDANTEQTAGMMLCMQVVSARSLSRVPLVRG